jgi:hypothetical protein
MEDEQKYRSNVMKKSDMVRGMLFGAEFFTELYKEVVELGGSEELMFEKMKTGTGLAKEIAKLIVAGANSAKKFALKSLKLITGGIAIVTESFTKDSFFTKNGPVKLYFWDNFTNLILAAMPETIPAFQGKLLKTQLTEYMYDSAIVKELGWPNQFTVGEFAAIIRDLLTKQPNGEDGTLLNNGYANIFYVQLEDSRMVAVDVRWHSDIRGWGLNAIGLDDFRWFDGFCVFSRS